MSDLAAKLIAAYNMPSAYDDGGWTAATCALVKEAHFGVAERDSTITTLRAELAAAGAREAGLRAILKDAREFITMEVLPSRSQIRDMDDRIDAALASPGPRAEAMAKVVEAAAAYIIEQWGSLTFNIDATNERRKAHEAPPIEGAERKFIEAVAALDGQANG